MSRNFVFFTSILLLLTGSIVYNGSAEPFLVVGANYSTDRIDSGDIVRFTGSLFSNSSSGDTKVISMNVTLGLFGSKITAAHYSKVYDLTRQSFEQNSTITGTITEKLDLEGGEYNVSIFFDIRDGAHTTPNKIESYYVMINQSLLVRGINDPTLAITVTLILVIVSIVMFVVFSRKS